MGDRLTEREVKLSAWGGFELPAFGGLAEGVTPESLEPRTLDAVYHDTADLRLARWGATLRYRSGDGRGWTVKLPGGDNGGALVRRELPFPGPPDRPPREAIELVRAFVRNARVAPVAHLRTHRRGVALRDEEGHRLAEVVDDEVTVLDGRRVAARFREVEAEVDDRAPAGLLDAMVGRLREAGAGEADQTPKLVRALGARALGPPDVAVAQLGPDPTAGDVIQAAVGASVVRILRHDAGVRLGDDPEDVHQARVGTRRLRSDLRTFRPLVDAAWANGLREELRWLASLLGQLRDADVLIDRLRQEAAALPEVDAAVFAPLLVRLADEQEGARRRLSDAMSSPRYIDLLDRLVAGANAPPLRPEAHEAARDVLPGLVALRMRDLRKAVDQLPREPSDEAVHQVRICAKRARYATEAVAPAIGKPAWRLAKALARVQGLLGDHQDAVVAETWLRRAADGADVVQAVALGELIAAQRTLAASCREAWPDAWRKADRKKLRAWLR